MASLKDRTSRTSELSLRYPAKSNLYVRCAILESANATAFTVNTGLVKGSLMMYKCGVLQPLRQQYAALLTSKTDTVRSFVAQQDHMQVFRFVLGCLDYLNG